MKIREFVEVYHIQMSVIPTHKAGEWAPDHPDMSMNHWLCTLRMGRRHMVTPFRTGVGIVTWGVEDVLECLAGDAAGYENARNFDDWNADYGGRGSKFDREVYRQVGVQTRRLKKFLRDQYEALVWGEQ